MTYPYQIHSMESYRAEYKKSIEDPENFWAGIAEHFQWKKKWDKVLSWNFKDPDVQWFSGAQLNITENCLDRHLASQGNQPAIIWEPNDPAAPNRVISYRELHEKVCAFANVLKKIIR